MRRTACAVPRDEPIDALPLRVRLVRHTDPAGGDCGWLNGVGPAPEAVNVQERLAAVLEGRYGALVAGVVEPCLSLCERSAFRTQESRTSCAASSTTASAKHRGKGSGAGSSALAWTAVSESEPEDDAGEQDALHSMMPRWPGPGDCTSRQPQPLRRRPSPCPSRLAGCRRWTAVEDDQQGHANIPGGPHEACLASGLLTSPYLAVLVRAN